MNRVARRITRRLREQWATELSTVGFADQAPLRGAPTNRGSDYSDADSRWVCDRKKSYPTEEFAAHVAGQMNEKNSRRPGDYNGVVVRPYACGRCGFYHVGR